MSIPTEAMCTEATTVEGDIPKVAMAVEGAAPEVLPAEILVEVPKSPQTPRPRPTPTKEGLKIKKGKQVAPSYPVCASPRKHPQKVKPTIQEEGKMINLKLEEEEF